MQEYSQGVPAFFISHGFILLLAGNTKHNLFRVFCVIRGFFWGLLRKKSLGEIFNEIWPLARNQSSSEFRRNLYGCFGGCLRQEIFGGNLV